MVPEYLHAVYSKCVADVTITFAARVVNTSLAYLEILLVRSVTGRLAEVSCKEIKL